MYFYNVKIFYELRCNLKDYKLPGQMVILVPSMSWKVEVIQFFVKITMNLRPSIPSTLRKLWIVPLLLTQFIPAILWILLFTALQSSSKANNNNQKKMT